MVDQDALHETVEHALAQADARGDSLIAALLSQALALLDDRPPGNERRTTH